MIRKFRGWLNPILRVLGIELCEIFIEERLVGLGLRIKS